MNKIKVAPREQADHIKLLQGAFRSRTVLLLIAVLLTWGLWAALKTGDNKVTSVVEAWCLKQREAVLSKWKLPTAIPLQLDSTISDVIQATFDPKHAEWKLADLGQVNALCTDLAAADARCNELRTAAYIVKIRVPYLLEPISIDGLLLVDFWPFVMIAIACAVAVFQLRELANAVVLSAAATIDSEPISRQLLHIRSNYRVGLLTEEMLNGRPFQVYRSPMIVQPESLFVWTLLVLTLYASFSLEATHRIELSHDMTSVLFDYISVLGLYSAGMVYLVYKTWLYYGRSLEDLLGTPVIGSVRFKFKSWYYSPFVEKPVTNKFALWLSQLLSKLKELPDSVLALAALISLALPWMKPGRIPGYCFLFKAKNLNEDLAVELQYQLWIAVVFVLSCLVISLVKKHVSTVALQRIKKWNRRLGLVVALLLCNLVFHILVLRIIASTMFIVGFGTIFSHPLLPTDPGIGFIVFIVLFYGLIRQRAPNPKANNQPLATPVSGAEPIT